MHPWVGLYQADDQVAVQAADVVKAEGAGGVVVGVGVEGGLIAEQLFDVG
jgi:hypothetical protein